MTVMSTVKAARKKSEEKESQSKSTIGSFGRMSVSSSPSTLDARAAVAVDRAFSRRRSRRSLLLAFQHYMYY